MNRRDFLRRSAVASVPALLSGCGVALPVSDRASGSNPEAAWLDQFVIDETALSRALAALGAKGADFGEIFFQARSAATYRLSGGRLQVPEDESVSGAGLRVVRGEASGFRHTTDLSSGALVASAQEAAALLSSGDSYPSTARRFVPPGGTYVAADMVSADVAEKIVRDLDRRIRDADDAISDVEVSLTMSDDWVLMATLDGRLVADRRPMTRLSVQAVMTRGGITQSGFVATGGRYTADRLGYERLDRLAAQVIDRTAILFEARRPPEDELPVLLSAGTSGVLIHESIGHAFEADFVAAGRSPFGDEAGSKIAADEITLIDDATLVGERGSLNVDDEGEPGRRTVIVEAGRLGSLVNDRRTALAGGSEPTGNGRRESFAHEPLPRMTCTFVENGSREPGELVESIGRGIVAETYTGGTVDPGGGDFRFRVKHGWFVENGRKTVPLRDFELVGNGPQLLSDITLVANDGRLDEGGWTCLKKNQSVPVSQGMPSVVVARLGINPL